MELKRAGSQPSGKGPSDWFTGTVRVDPLFQAPEPALVSGAERDVRTRCTDRMAHSPTWTNAYHYCGLWMGAARGRTR